MLLTAERDEAKADAERRGRNADASNFQLSDKENARAKTEKLLEDTRRTADEFKAGATAFVATLKGFTVAPESLPEMFVAAVKPVPIELLIACGIDETRATELLTFVATAKAKSEDSIIHSLHKDKCRDRWKAGSRCGGPCPSAEQARILKAILNVRGVKDIEQKILILQTEHNPNAAVYIAPVELPPVIDIEQERYARENPPPPAPTKRSIVDCTRWWTDLRIMDNETRYQRFVEDLNELYPGEPTDRQTFDALTLKGRSQEKTAVGLRSSMSVTK